jgi:60 kDa SS-A/Ro ribonucleoprotein
LTNNFEETEETTMANKTLFASLHDALIPQTDTVNSENAPAYALAPKQALAQYAATGCFGRTFYATAEEQLTRVLELCDAVEPEFIARLAIYSRTQSFMKDMPACYTLGCPNAIPGCTKPFSLA